MLWNIDTMFVFVATESVIVFNDYISFSILKLLYVNKNRLLIRYS